MPNTKIIEIELSNEQAVSALRNGANAVHDLRPFFGSIGEWLLASHYDRHQKDTEPNGEKWVDLKPTTWGKKKNKKMLFESNLMLGTRGASYEATQNQLVFGFSDEKAVWHHFGTHSKSGNKILPSRKLIGLSKEDESEIIKLGKEHIIAAITSQL